MTKTNASPEKLLEFKSMVKETWPGDEKLLEIHLIRMIRQEKARGLSVEETVRFYSVCNSESPAA